MAGAATTLLRSVARRSKAPVQMGARALRRPHPQRQPLPQPQAEVFSSRLFFNGEHLHGQDLLPRMASSTRFFSSGTHESPNKAQNPVSSCTGPAGEIEACANQEEPMTFRKYIEKKNEELREHSHNMQVTAELKEQIEEKKEELFRLLLQMDSDRSISESQKCEQGKEQLLRLLQEFQTKTQAQKSQWASGFVKFMNFTTFAVVVLFAMKVSGSH